VAAVIVADAAEIVAAVEISAAVAVTATVVPVESIAVVENTARPVARRRCRTIPKRRSIVTRRPRATWID
jgi:hypothetical protein